MAAAGAVCIKHRFLFLGNDRKWLMSTDGTSLGVLHDMRVFCFPVSASVRVNLKGR